jgi:YD repeat-containing protein
MKNLLPVITLFISVTLNAQYYYNDIIGTREISAKMKAYQNARVQSVTAAGYDPKGAKTTDFNEWQDMLSGGSVLKVTTRNGQIVTRIYYQFDNKTRLINASDSSTDIQNTTEYSYDAKENLVSIKTTTRDAKQDFNETEEHQWQYTANGKPEKMLRIINSKDSSEYRFTFDENGNVADEQLLHRAVGKDPIYYYYDDKNRVSDIVRYNKNAKKLLPDVMFEYDENNRVIQRITTLSARVSDYLIWRYLFNDKGLKTKEALFNKNKELRGRIEYSYSFMP